MNLCFEYLYRDSENYKNWGEIVFSNKENISTEVISKKIIDNIEEGMYFSANDLNVKDLRPFELDPLVDHDRHEFHCCTLTSDKVTDPLGRDISTILQYITAGKKKL